MELKKSLKSVKTNESAISMIIGVIVILAVGILVVRYFRNINENSTLPPISTEAESSDFDEEGRKIHIIATGESLWLIAQNEYGDGFKWVRIASENNITSPIDIKEGQEIVLPNLEEEKIVAEEDIALNDIENELVETTKDEISLEITQDSEEEVETTTTEPISGATYTVVRGDHLWSIAVRAYGDGYRWVDIAAENELVNPDLIHAGNVLRLPQ